MFLQCKVTVLVSLGVRMSTFSNDDDKKHQQRSIIGFLQAGHQAVSSPGCVLDKTDKPEFVKPLEMSLKKSFFDKKRSERILSHQDAPRCETVDQQAVQISQPFQALKKMSESLETSKNPNNYQTFTCPVCFREQEGISLEAFNEHVDACLDEPSTSENSYSHASSAAIGQKEDAHHSIPLCEKRDYEDAEVTSADGVDLVETEVIALKAASMDTLGSNHSKEECSDIPNQSCPVSLANETVRILSKQEPIQPCTDEVGTGRALVRILSKQESIQPCTDEVVTGRALVCPVCNLEQKTSDLTLFNVHVDICLNKGIIQELKNNEVNSANQPKGSSRSTGEHTVVKRNAARGGDRPVVLARLA